MDDAIQAVTDEISDALRGRYNLSVDETGCRNPDKYDDDVKRLDERIAALRAVRLSLEEVVLKTGK